MPDGIEVRIELLEAMEALHQAHAALLEQDTRTAVLKIALSEAILGEVRKKLSTPPTP